MCHLDWSEDGRACRETHGDTEDGLGIFMWKKAGGGFCVGLPACDKVPTEVRQQRGGFLGSGFQSKQSLVGWLWGSWACDTGLHHSRRVWRQIWSSRGGQADGYGEEEASPCAPSRHMPLLHLSHLLRHRLVTSLWPVGVGGCL